ncbi:hypothetical protein O1611_g3767 [Lasiodiplodia mahajangana]|uniref:Uncharacterized protein n=1 Tax=Lasiodiplodia mahajangana TaxID=1108764 RepID=A0ACC2JQZ4_9PEZI|nr:hypothetical protein O1611_g3767 [Lasiodiplodia mahajangana]
MGMSYFGGQLAEGWRFFSSRIQDSSESDHRSLQSSSISLEPSTSRRPKMNHLSILSLLLLASEAVAIPATKTFAARRDNIGRQDTQPSSYPGGDSPACANEIQYLNFDVNDDQQLTRVQSAHQAFCTGWAQLLVLGSGNIDDTDRTLFARYFIDNDDTKSEVSQVYSALIDTNKGEANSIVKDMILDNNDFLGLCPESGGDDEDAGEEGAYWGVDGSGDGREKFHLCNSAFDFSTLPADNECTELDDHPDVSMESLARLILHETLHFRSVGNPIFNSQIRDEDNDDELRAYYPQRTHGLVDTNQDNADGQTGETAVTNADSYAWHAANSYYKYACNGVNEPGPNGGNWNDPPAYTPNEPGDA